MNRDHSSDLSKKMMGNEELTLPFLQEGLEASFSKGHSMVVSGTNVVRVPFGVRQPVKQRPARPDRSITLVLPFQPQGHPTPPPQAA